MKQILKDIRNTAVVMGVIMGASLVFTEKVNDLDTKSKSNQYENNTPAVYAPHQKFRETMWDAADTNKDGTLDELTTPHRNNLYGTNGPVYIRGHGDLEGEIALEYAKLVIDYKKDFSKIDGTQESFYWGCKVDDFNGDGKADMISWPNIKGKSNIHREFFPEGITEKADRVLAFENYIRAYINKE